MLSLHLRLVVEKWDLRLFIIMNWHQGICIVRMHALHRSLVCLSVCVLGTSLSLAEIAEVNMLFGQTLVGKSNRLSDVLHIGAIWQMR